MCNIVDHVQETEIRALEVVVIDEDVLQVIDFFKKSVKSFQVCHILIKVLSNATTSDNNRVLWRYSSLVSYCMACLSQV